MEFTVNTSNYLEYASTRMRSMYPSTGPAKSKCNLDHCLDGHSQGCSGALAGAGWWCWHSPSLRYGYPSAATTQTFLLNISCCLSLDGLHEAPPKRGLPGEGITTWFLHKIQPSCTDNLAHWDAKGWRPFSSWLLGQPSCTNLKTHDNSGSRLVQVLIWEAVTGKALRLSNNNTVSAGMGGSLAGPGNRRQLMASALPFWVDVLKAHTFW